MAQRIERRERCRAHAGMRARLETIANLARPVQHDINNLLTVIFANLEMLKRTAAEGGAAAPARPGGGSGPALRGIHPRASSTPDRGGRPGVSRPVRAERRRSVAIQPAAAVLIPRVHGVAAGAWHGGLRRCCWIAAALEEALLALGGEAGRGAAARRRCAERWRRSEPARPAVAGRLGRPAGAEVRGRRLPLRRRRAGRRRRRRQEEPAAGRSSALSLPRRRRGPESRRQPGPALDRAAARLIPSHRARAARRLLACGSLRGWVASLSARVSAIAESALAGGLPAKAAGWGAEAHRRIAFAYPALAQHLLGQNSNRDAAAHAGQQTGDDQMQPFGLSFARALGTAAIGLGPRPSWPRPRRSRRRPAAAKPSMRSAPAARWSAA